MLLLAKNSTLPKLTRNGRLFLGGALLGVLVFVLVFGVSTLDVTNDAFCRGGYIEKDIQQHYAGWLFYRQSSAGWPLCIARGINYPDGLSVAYTDSIPLVAALLKPVANFVGGTFQYMGWFTLVCFALQGGFGALLAGLFLPGCAAPLAADLLFVTSPVLFERVFRHTSLGAQFFVLAALYFYFAARRKGQYASRGLFVLNVLAVGIHPYFLPMTYAIMLALLLEYALHNRQLAGPGLYLAANFGGTALLCWALGLLYGSASSGGQALYGYFCMNLNALWNPVGVNGVLYSRVLPAQNQVYGNYDAFAYLGLGVLIALPIAVVLLRRQLGGMLRHSSQSVVGRRAERYLDDVACSKLFLGVDGIDFDFGITTTDMREAELNQAMMHTSQKTIVLADSSKFGRRGFSKIANLDDIDIIITDAGIPQSAVARIEELGIELIIAKP